MGASKTYFERHPQSAKQMQKLKMSANDYKEGQIGCRTLAKDMTKILKLKAVMGHETAKRLAKQALQKK